jgi:hypothetical protein
MNKSNKCFQLNCNYKTSELYLCDVCNEQNRYITKTQNIILIHYKTHKAMSHGTNIGSFKI